MKKHLLLVVLAFFIGIGITYADNTTNNSDKPISHSADAAGEGISFSVITSYYPNLSVKAGKNEGGTDQFQNLTITGDGAAILPSGWQFINFEGKDDAKIVSIMRNGSPVPFSAYVGWRSTVEEGDVFTVVTTGPEMEVTFKANEASSGLDIFNVTVNESPLNLSGESQKVTLHRGDIITVSGKGVNVCNWVKYGSTLYENIPATFNLSTNDDITISGESVKGVFINVSNASSVVIKQLNGYGTALPLQDGENEFALSDLKNNLSISPAEGCMITSVIVNQAYIQPSTTGDYSITATDGMLIEIQAKPIPTTIPLTVMVCDTDNDNAVSDLLASNVRLRIDGVRVDLEGMTSVMAPYMTEVNISGEFGFVIDKVEAGNNFIQEADRTYTFFAENPCTLMIYMHQIVAPEGYALVQFVENSNKIGFYPYDSDKNRIEGSFDSTQPGVIKIGNYIGVKKFSYDYLFKSISVNGVPIKIDKEQEAFQEYLVKITGDCTIEALLYDPNEGTLLITCWDSHDGTFGVKIADLYVNDHGNLTKQYNAVPGEEVEFVLPYIAPGYTLKYLAGKSVSSPDLKDLTSLKFKVPETVINPETGDPFIYIFEPLCEVNPANPPYILEFYPTYIDSEQVSEGKEVVGYLVGIDPYENKETTMMFATAGQEVTILSYERDDYVFERMFTNTNRTISSPYTVSPEDAFTINGHNKINIGADYVPRDSKGIDEVSNSNSLKYDSATQTLISDNEIKVLDLSGNLIGKGTNIMNVSDLDNGLYIAISGSDTIKFIKRK